MAERIRYELGLNTWTFTIGFDRSGGPEIGEGRAVAMEINSSWEYRDIALMVYCASIADFSDERLETTIRHEFMHAMVSPMRREEPNEYERKLEEQVCTDLAQAITFTVKQRLQDYEDERKLAEKRAARASKKAAAAA